MRFFHTKWAIIYHPVWCAHKNEKYCGFGKINTAITITKVCTNLLFELWRVCLTHCEEIIRVFSQTRTENLSTLKTENSCARFRYVATAATPSVSSFPREAPPRSAGKHHVTRLFTFELVRLEKLSAFHIKCRCRPPILILTNRIECVCLNEYFLVS